MKTRLQCRKPGRTACDCPARSNKQEAAGRSASRSASHVVSTVDSSVPLNSYSVEEMEEYLADKKISVETALMGQASQKNALISVVHVSSAVGYDSLPR